MIYTTKAEAKRQTGLNYLGSVNLTTKHQKAYNYGELTYSLYLAPAKLSGYEVCPMRSKECTRLCLNESGMNRMSMNEELINKSRIAKTKLFFEEREFFINWLFDEIKSAEAKAKKLDDPVSWNFGKFLLDEKGELIATFSPRTTPLSEEITRWLK